MPPVTPYSYPLKIFQQLPGQSPDGPELLLGICGILRLKGKSLDLPDGLPGPGKPFHKVKLILIALKYPVAAPDQIMRPLPADTMLLGDLSQGQILIDSLLIDAALMLR